jgi:hypothetical protein
MREEWGRDDRKEGQGQGGHCTVRGKVTKERFSISDSCRTSLVEVLV